MSVSPAPIPRSEFDFDRATFLKLIQLHQSQPWVLEEEASLLQLVSECGSLYAKDVVLTLLHQFRYFALSEAQAVFSDLIKKAQEKWALEPNSTYFSCLSDPGHASSGQVVLNWAKQHLASQGDWEKKRFLTDCPRAAYNAETDGAIVFVDDFVGTGRTLQRKSSWVRKTLASRGDLRVKLYLVALTSMSAAQSVVQTCTDDSLVGEYLQRGISDQFAESQRSPAIFEMLRLEGLLSPMHNGRKLPSMGFEKSESLYALEKTSTPNNVFPIFWWPVALDGTRRRTLLTRA
jgi:hypothetical protein